MNDYIDPLVEACKQKKKEHPGISWYCPNISFVGQLIDNQSTTNIFLIYILSIYSAYRPNSHYNKKNVLTARRPALPDGPQHGWAHSSDGGAAKSNPFWWTAPYSPFAAQVRSTLIFWWPPYFGACYWAMCALLQSIWTCIAEDNQIIWFRW